MGQHHTLVLNVLGVMRVDFSLGEMGYESKSVESSLRNAKEPLYILLVGFHRD